MIIARTAAELDEATSEARAGDGIIGLVPTMGALHEGHLSLVRSAGLAASSVVMSIFVNPLQFGAGEDLEAYPRDEEGDLELAEGAGVDVAFLPSVEPMYPPGRMVTIDAGPLGEVYEGAERPGHFAGVCTVVAKLLNLVRPQLAFFGQKDAQQVAVVKRMVIDLSYPVQIEVCPTVRDRDGLALSSRNVYLSESDRRRALALYESLVAGREALERGGDAPLADKTMWKILSETEGLEPDYAAAVDPDTFAAALPGSSTLLVVAARVGKARLIDNLLVG